MKKYFSCLFAALLVMMMIVSCGKDKKEEKVESGTETVVSQTEAPVKVSKNFKKACNLFSGTGIFVPDEEKDGKLRWIGSMPKGMEVFAASKGDEIEKIPMNLINDKEGAKPSEMALIKFEESDSEVYYALEANLELGFTLVVVGDDICGDTPYTFVYNSDDIGKVTGIKVPAGTLVVAKDTFGYEDFCKVTFYIADGASKGFYREKYLETRALENSKRYIVTAMVADRFDHTKDLKSDVQTSAANNYRAALENLDSDSESRSDDEFQRFYGLMNMLDR